jgi:hypothetical protein
VVQRLHQAGYEPVQQLFNSLGLWLQAYLTPPACDLAPSASSIVALDETKLDAVVRRLPWHSLLLFDLGDFSFPFFDYLTERGYDWISRYREKTRYQLVPVYSRHHEILDALVWLGCEHGARAGSAVRLVRFGSGSHLYLYFSKVLDPLQLPMGDMARL